MQSLFLSHTHTYTFPDQNVGVKTLKPIFLPYMLFLNPFMFLDYDTQIHTFSFYNQHSLATEFTNLFEN